MGEMTKVCVVRSEICYDGMLTKTFQSGCFGISLRTPHRSVLQRRPSRGEKVPRESGNSFGPCKERSDREWNFLWQYGLEWECDPAWSSWIWYATSLLRLQFSFSYGQKVAPWYLMAIFQLETLPVSYCIPSMLEAVCKCLRGSFSMHTPQQISIDISSSSFFVCHCFRFLCSTTSLLAS